MNIVFQVHGGIGKNVMATAVCKAIKEQYPADNLIVITNYPQVFFCNPSIHKVFSVTELRYFYKDYIEGQQVKMCLHEPYLDTDFVSQQGHLIEVWCQLNGIRYSGQMPELFLTQRERIFYSRQFSADKPIMVIQTNGGGIEQQIKYSWTRDLPYSTAQQIVNTFAADYHVVQIKREDQLQLQNATPVQLDFRALAVLISLSAKRLFIDSFAQHTAAALGLPSVVCWVGTKRQQFGYALHENIIANPPTIKPELRSSVFTRYNIFGQPTEFCYNNEDEIFNIDNIIRALNENVNDAITNTSQAVDKIAIESNTSMVAKRLSALLGKIDIGQVKQIVDIGSWHLGQSIEFARIFTAARIDAFEPVPTSYDRCLNNRNGLSRQQKERIHVHNIALSDKEANIPFYAVDPSQSSVPNVGASSMFRFIDGLNGSMFGQNLIQEEIEVQSTTLDRWCKKQNVNGIDIMWMDVQGAELLVLKGADKILENTRIIMTEVGLKPYYEGHTLKQEIDTFLFAKGFRELEGAFELNGFDYEANTIYVNNNL